MQKVILERLKILAERIYPEAQCGFRPERSTIDMIFSLRQLQEKCREQNRPLYMAFVDLTKAFDLVSREGLFKILDKIGCPPKLKKMIESFHTNMRGTVQFDGSTSESFPILSGVKQGCVLAPTLFGIFFSVVLNHAFRNNEYGVYLHSRSDGRLFNIRRLKAETKIRHVLIRELLFADDAAIVAHSQADLQQLINSLAKSCDQFGLTISLKKTEIMCQNVNAALEFKIGDYTLNVVEEFTYLGATVNTKLSLDSEINKRIGKASAAMAKLSKKVWENKKLTTRTKMMVYQACVLSTLLYGAESWTTYAVQEQRLNVFHLRCLRRILHITWKDYKTNGEILSKAKMTSIFTILSKHRLRWIGHVRRMPDGRIPKDILYGQLSIGERARGRPKLRYTDVCKRDMKYTDINVQTWEQLAEDRGTWRTTVNEGLKSAEKKRIKEWESKRERRKNSQKSSRRTTNTFSCTYCNKICLSRVGLFSHERSCSSCRP